MDVEQLTERVWDLDQRLSAVEVQVKSCATVAELSQTTARIELAHHETALALKNLAEKFEHFSVSYGHWLKERALAEKEEREEKMKMLHAEHEAKMKALEAKTWPEAIVRWSKALSLVTLMITILTALVGAIIWIAKNAK